MSALPGRTLLFGIAFCAGLFGQVHPAAQESAPSFIISGTSTVRSWSCPAKGTIKVTPGKSSQPVPGFPNGVQAVVITVAVQDIACEEKEMGEHLRDTLNDKTHPAIVYQLEQYAMTGETAAKTTGQITIAGVTKPIAFDVKLIPSPPGVRSVGETSIDMTQFGVTPPTLWMGMLKVGANVRIRFEAVLQPSR